jgi:hypothetical protein
VKTEVRFRSDRFNTAESREYFLNPGCFGDDLCRWLRDALRARGVATDDEPGQEDFGWYLGFRAGDGPHVFVVGFEPGDGGDPGRWIGWLERDGLAATLLGRRRRGVSPRAVELVDAVLSGAPEVRDVSWHDRS